MRRGNQRDFAGVFMQLSGDDDKLNDVLDELDYVAGVVVTDRRDVENLPDSGILSLQCNAHSRSIVTALAKTHGLQVM